MRDEPFDDKLFFAISDGLLDPGHWVEDYIT
jgi:hypothetical protein